MNVQELISELQKHPPEMRVIRKGYEGGFEDLQGASPIEIVVNGNRGGKSDGKGWWIGRHCQPSNMLPPQQQGDETALLIT